MTQAFDEPGRLIEAKAANSTSVLADLVYSYGYTDGSGQHVDSDQRQTETDKVANVTTTYTYDGLNRVTDAKLTGSASGDYAYAYDANGNITSKTDNGTQTGYAYNAANQLCWSKTATATGPCSPTPTGATSYTYDANGNFITGSSGLSLGYNPKNQTNSMTPAVGGSAFTLSYRGEGESELVGLGGTAVGNSTLGVSSLLPSGQATTQYFTRDPDGTLLDMRVGTTHDYFFLDPLGSVRGLFNDTGAVANTYRYEPYGTIASQTGTVDNRLLYTGELRSNSSQLYHIGARWYDPNTGRWTQQDPLNQVNDLTQNDRYAYVGDDPINDVDPSGLCSIFKCIARGASIVWHSHDFRACAAWGVGGAIAGSRGGWPGAVVGAVGGCGAGIVSRHWH